MKRIVLIIATAICAVCLFGCSGSKSNQVDDSFGFVKEDFEITEEKDSHGGFVGDGDYYLILDCSKNQEKVDEIISDWEALPLSENLELIMYGGTKDGTTYSYELYKIGNFPKIENGYYKFIDRNSNVSKESGDASDDSNLFKRHSFNFSIAMYDSDTKTMYYLEFDT